MSLNKVMLIGNVGRDPEIRYLEGNGQGTGAKVATFTLATTERYRDRNGELRENTEWHNIVAWRNSADIIERFVRKGSQLYIEGRLRTRSYTDQQGVRKYTTEITVDNIQLLGRRQDDQNGYQGSSQDRQNYRDGQYGRDGYQQDNYRQGGSYQGGGYQNSFQGEGRPSYGDPQSGYDAASEAAGAAAQTAARTAEQPLSDYDTSEDLPF